MRTYQPSTDGQMTEYTAKRNPNRCPSHPGALLREALESVQLSKAEIAEALGISRQHIYDLINEKKPVSPQIAVRLGKLLGNGPGLWLRMQNAYDLWHAEREVDTSGIDPTIIIGRTIELDDGMEMTVKVKRGDPTEHFEGRRLRAKELLLRAKEKELSDLSYRVFKTSPRANRKAKAMGGKATPKASKSERA